MVLHSKSGIPNHCAKRSLPGSDNSALNKGLPLALTEVTRRNPPRVVQGKELVLSDWKTRHTCPAQGSQETEKFITLLSLSPPPHFCEGQHPSDPQCAMQQTSISRQQAASTSKVDSPLGYSTPLRVLLNLHVSSICPWKNFHLCRWHHLADHSDVGSIIGVIFVHRWTVLHLFLYCNRPK